MKSFLYLVVVSTRGWASHSTHSRKLPHGKCLTEGVDVEPAVASGFSVHSRDCQNRCDQVEACRSFRFWENGQCTLFDRVGTIVNFGDEGHALYSRNLLSNFQAYDKKLSRNEFDRIPRNIKANAPFELVETVLEKMLQIWNASPGTPIYPRDLKNYGLNLAGRMQGRVIATLAKMGYVMSRHDGGVLMMNNSSTNANDVLESSLILNIEPSLTPSALRYVSGPKRCGQHKQIVVHVGMFMEGITSTRRHDNVTQDVAKMNLNAQSKEPASPIYAFCTYSGNMIGNVTDKTLEMCQARCASTALCAYFSFSRDGNCRFFDSLAERVQASENNWCGPTPLCPYRHWLRSPRSDVYRAHDTQARTFVCTSSQQNDKKYPWPWFNQFNLEALLLRRWRSELSTCRHGLFTSETRCTQDADIIIVPSLYMHSSRFNEVNPWDDLNGRFKKDIADIDRGKRHRLYWEMVKRRYERVSSNQTSYWPLIVVHYSYVTIEAVFDAPYNTAMVHSLGLQPLAFQERVVIVAIESNIHESDLSNLPVGWSSNGLAYPHQHKGFRIVTVPYPTTVTLPKKYFLNLRNSDGVKYQERPILVLLSGSQGRGASTNTGREGYSNMVRPTVFSLMKEAGATFAVDSLIICTPGHEAACTELVSTYHDERMWDLASNSIFCVEPPGDTLTRSHFYVGVASGCIPVIFDGGDGSGLYGNNTPTFWPWRVFDSYDPSHDSYHRLLREIGLDYSRFCVIVGVADLQNPQKNFAKDLQRMYQDDPDLVKELQIGVDEAAPAMVYSPSFPRVITDPGYASHSLDAFSRLVSLLSSPVVTKASLR